MLELPLANWAAWPAIGGASGAPDVSFIQPLLRRRLSLLGRAALHVAHLCSAQLPSVRLVYASRHGELSRTLELLEALAARELVSPIAFSLSVHNAAGGIFSIQRADRAPVTAIAAGAATLGFGLLEAYSQFASLPSEPVLLVHADEVLPEAYRGHAEGPPATFALGLLFAAGGGRRLSFSWGECTDADDSPASQADTLRAALGAAGRAQWRGAGRCWKWSCQS